MPFLAHAMGTFVGAMIAALIAKTYKVKMAMVIAFFFLLGGTMMVIQLPSPLWFNVLDLGFAYVPMALIASKLVVKNK